MRDKTDPKAPVSIAAVGMALATIPVVVERGVIIREFAAKITRKRLRYLLECPQGPEPDASGYKGFFYHFLDIETGRRVWQCELSTIDSAFLFAGALTVATYFDRDTADEAEIRSLADTLYQRADWNWARNGGRDADARLAAGERIYPTSVARLRRGIAALHPGTGLADTSIAAGKLSRLLRDLSMEEDLRPRVALFRPTLYASAFAHVDRLSRHPRRLHEAASSDYFENSRQATFVQQEYAVRNPMNFVGYGKHCWGFTACDGPGWTKRVVNGVEREFFDYIARGAPFGPDDGTVAPGWFSPPCRSLRRSSYPPCAISPEWIWNDRQIRVQALVQSIVRGGGQCTGWWVTPYHFGIDQGPVVLMIENYRTGLLWDIMRRCLPVLTGLRRAGFTGGWL